MRFVVDYTVDEINRIIGEKMFPGMDIKVEYVIEELFNPGDPGRNEVTSVRVSFDGAKPDGGMTREHLVKIIQRMSEVRDLHRHNASGDNKDFNDGAAHGINEFLSVIQEIFGEIPELPPSVDRY